MREADTYLLKQMEMSWANMQHNEKLRNHLFSLYLVISGILFAFIGGKEPPSDSRHLNFEIIAIFLGFFVWLVGILFVWAYTRFGQMIARDARVVRAIIEEIGESNEGYDFLSSIYKNYYSNIDERKILVFGSVNTCLSLTTLAISISALTFSLWVLYSISPETPYDWLNFNPYLYFLVALLSSCSFNVFLKRTFEKRWGSFNYEMKIVRR